MQRHIEKPNNQEQEFNTAAVSEARLSDSIDLQRINRNHSGELQPETTEAKISNPLPRELQLETTEANISNPLPTDNNLHLQPQPLPSTTNCNMPSSFTSTLTNGSTSTNNIQHYEPAKQRPQQQSRCGSACPDQCWAAGDAGSSGNGKKTLVLCFDGTGNKFKGNSGDTNILKIFSMLDRRKGDQYHYYQPGIGTYLTSRAMTHRTGGGTSARFKSAYQKAIDAAVGKSFDQHVMGGYRFIMRYYHPGDDIYMFGFSRGAYTARFLCEMLDHVGLVVQGNEEMVHFAWKTFSSWQMRAHDNHSVRGKRKKKEMYNYMKAFRETFTRPVKRVRFLGLFDTVNSVPRFEDAWLKRASRFPYTARSTARVIRHAVGLDERRAKFRQDLVEKVDLEELNDSILRDGDKKRQRSWGEKEKTSGPVKTGLVKGPITALNGKIGGLQPARRKAPSDPSLLGMGLDQAVTSSYSLNIHFDREDGDDDDTEQDVEELWFPGCHGDIGGGWDLAPDEPNLSYGPLVWMVREARRAGLAFDERRLREQHCYTDLDTIYDHGQDTSKLDEGAAAVNPMIEVQNATPTSSPIFREAPEKSFLFHTLSEQNATNGLGRCGSSSKLFDAAKESSANIEFDSTPDHTDDGVDIENWKRRDSGPLAAGTQESAASLNRNINEQATTTSPRSPPHRNEITDDIAAKLKAAYTRSKIHCCLTFGGGLPHMSTLGWRMMEYLPFRRMDLQKDGSWKAISWPLPRGEVRDVPEDAKIHCSVLHRMAADPSYRPGNLLVGGGGRGVRVAPPQYKMGEWVVLREEGSLVGEVLVKKSNSYPRVPPAP